MSDEILFTADALLDLKHLRKHEQQTIIAGIERLLQTEPTVQTRNRKLLRPTGLASWEARLGKFRVFYDVSPEAGTVTVKAVGWKEHESLLVRGKEFRL